jgi:hypothetical protein
MPLIRHREVFFIQTIKSECSFSDDIKLVGTGDRKVALLFNPLTYVVLLLRF